MKYVEIEIRMTPVEAGGNWIIERMFPKEEGALIIGTNGSYRFVQGNEAIDFLDKLVGCAAAERMGKTDYILLYSQKKEIILDTVHYMVGSAMIVKEKNGFMGLLDRNELEKALDEFESRLVTLSGGDYQFSAYEIG